MATKRQVPASTEVDAYIYIKKRLDEQGWDVRNPHRCATGRVYTQNECREHPAIKQYLGLERPENIVVVSDTTLWVIEAKRNQNQLAQAVREAEAYARKINQGRTVTARFISGVAGNEATGYLVQTLYLVNNTYRAVQFNGKDASSLLSPEVVLRVMESGPKVADVPINETLFLSKAEDINNHLHVGAINVNQRARIMAAILLSRIEETPPNVDAPPSVLISEINARAERILKKHKKSDFFKYIEIALPPTEDNHVKFKTAIVKTINDLDILNIRSAMNSGTDVLGKFYEVFLKYGNGAKEIGIVLTPRHVTRFAVETLGVTYQDVVFDPACGTGGFLVAAFDHVKRSVGRMQLDRFRNNNLFGVDQDAEVVALALVNMIFRGDGKNNITEGNCFQKNVIQGDSKVEYSAIAPKDDEQVVTKVLMNPPFAKPTSDEKEFKFVDHALGQMREGGMLFAVLPYPAMVKPGNYFHWRKESLLRNNTLMGVITFPPDLFYPIGVHTIGIFVKKGVPHPIRQNVLWARAINDGLLKSKGKRLPDSRATNDYPLAKTHFMAFLANPSYPAPNIKKVQKACPIEFDDPLLELVPENYLDDARPTQQEMEIGMEQVMRNTLAALVSEGARR